MGISVPFVLTIGDWLTRFLFQKKYKIEARNVPIEVGEIWEQNNNVKVFKKFYDVCLLHKSQTSNGNINETWTVAQFLRLSMPTAMGNIFYIKFTYFIRVLTIIHWYNIILFRCNKPFCF